MSEGSFPVPSLILHSEWASLHPESEVARFPFDTTNSEIAMTNHGKNHAVSNASSESGTALHADARRNGQNHHALPDDQIRMRAYELYVERGKQPSDGLRDWLEAEREYHERS